MTNVHLPVMLAEVMEYLKPQPGQIFVDGTLGGGGYTEALAKAVGLQGLILGIDLDPRAIAAEQEKIRINGWQQIKLVEGNFSDLDSLTADILPAETKIAGLVLDLGLSSNQLADPERGFSFQDSRPLDMAFGPSVKKSTKKIINHYSLEELTRLFQIYGEEPRARLIAKRIVESRKQEPIIRTDQLVNIILSVTPRIGQAKIHPATKVFQALRLATNEELDNLTAVLEAGLKILAPGGRMVIVSFHSLEDRLVKEFFKHESQNCICPPSFPVCRCQHRAKIKIITKKPLCPSLEEVNKNPRSRSAKLRVAEKI